VVIPGSPSLAEVLRSTLKRLEQNEDLASDDPALAELKATILRAITELEVGKTPRPLTQQKILWITPRAHPVEVAAPAALETPQASESEAEQAQEDALTATHKVAARKSRARIASGRRSG
jgi:hypothetical protein